MIWLVCKYNYGSTLRQKKKDITDAGSCEMQAFVSNFLAKNDTKRLKSHFNISKMIKGLLSKYIF